MSLVQELHASLQQECRTGTIYEARASIARTHCSVIVTEVTLSAKTRMVWIGSQFRDLQSQTLTA